MDKKNLHCSCSIEIFKKIFADESVQYLGKLPNIRKTLPKMKLQELDAISLNVA